MQGLRDGKSNNAVYAGNMNLNNLRKSTNWTSDRPIPRNNVLSERLNELLVFELREDGGRSYLNLTVRGLYRHALDAITSRPSRGPEPAEESEIPTLPLGQAILNQDPKEANATNPRERSVSFEAMHGSGSSRTSRFASVRGLPADDLTGCAGAGTATVTYRERLGAYLHPRDMRRLVTPFSASNEPELIIRRHAILLNFDPLRAIILRDRLLVLVPDGADSLLVNLERRVRGGSTEVEDSIFGKDIGNVSADIGSTDHSHLSSSSAAKKSNLMSKILKKGNSILHSTKSATPDSSVFSVLSYKSAEQQPVPSETATEDAISDEVDAYDDNDDNNEDNEWEEMAGKEWIDLPFELQCVDAVLHTVCGILTEDTSDLQDAALGYIKRLLQDHGGMADDPLTLIRAVKDAIREMRSRVKGFVKSMNRILDEDEDMALMNLSRLLTNPERFIQPVPQEVLEEESDEPELILEAHLQIAFTLENALELIQGQIDTASELVDQKLDAVRNRILYVNMVISVMSLCVGSASLVGSIFGMNLTNGLELDDSAFKQVTAGTIASAVALGILIISVLVYSGTIPRTRFHH